MDIKANSWPFIEARNLLNKINHKTPKKGYVLFETGYGPSGLPHIGTFGEVARTSMVIKAFNELAPNIPTKLICFSDDLDGLRKIPDNIPNKDGLIKELGKPLTAVSDPFSSFDSYGENMNHRLKEFLNKFCFKYEFYSSTKCYKTGIFNKTLEKIIFDNYANLPKIWSNIRIRGNKCK